MKTIAERARGARDYIFWKQSIRREQARLGDEIGQMFSQLKTVAPFADCFRDDYKSTRHNLTRLRTFVSQLEFDKGRLGPKTARTRLRTIAEQVGMIHAA